MDTKPQSDTNIHVTYKGNINDIDTKDSRFHRNNDIQEGALWMSTILCSVDEGNLGQWIPLDYRGFSLHYYIPIGPMQRDIPSAVEGKYHRKYANHK